MRIRTISVVGESHPKLEDFWYANFDGERLKAAVGDWANNLVGGPYKDLETESCLGETGQHYNGGIIGALLAKKTISGSEATGTDLLTTINQALAHKYEQLGITNYSAQRELTFTGYMAHFIATQGQMSVTAVGDVRIAVDGKIIAGRRKKIDARNSQLRAQYIEQTGDYKGGYKYIRPNIIAQYRFQNTPGHEFSYPAIDGTETQPLNEVDILKLPTPRRILMWTDGYVTPDEFTIEGLEKKLEQVFEEDPHRWQAYPEVGYLKDDRTAVEIILDSWDGLAIEKVQPLKI